jgi:hypothetical protein
MTPTSTDPSMLAVAGPAPLRSTVLAVASYTRQHANLLVSGHIISVLVEGVIRPKKEDGDATTAEEV